MPTVNFRPTTVPAEDLIDARNRQLTAGVNTLIYPEDLSTKTPHAFIINVIERKLNGDLDLLTSSIIPPNILGSLPPTGTNTQEITFNEEANVIASIALPVPRNFGEYYSYDYRNYSVTENIPMANFFDEFNNILSFIVGMDVVKFFQWGVGKRINPYTVADFQNVNLRHFRYEWIFAPNNQQEVEILHRIVRILRRQSAPTRNGIFGNLTIPSYFDYPDELLISIIGGQKHDFWPLNTCVITDLVFDKVPTNGSPAFFRQSGSSSFYMLTLDLQEVVQITRTEIDNFDQELGLVTLE